MANARSPKTSTACINTKLRYRGPDTRDKLLVCSLFSFTALAMGASSTARDQLIEFSFHGTDYLLSLAEHLSAAFNSTILSLEEGFCGALDFGTIQNPVQFGVIQEWDKVITLYRGLNQTAQSIIETCLELEITGVYDGYLREHPTTSLINQLLPGIATGGLFLVIVALIFLVCIRERLNRCIRDCLNHQAANPVPQQQPAPQVVIAPPAPPAPPASQQVEMAFEPTISMQTTVSQSATSVQPP